MSGSLAAHSTKSQYMPRSLVKRQLRLCGWDGVPDPFSFSQPVRSDSICSGKEPSVLMLPKTACVHPAVAAFQISISWC